jgi:hypothetical protein
MQSVLREGSVMVARGQKTNLGTVAYNSFYFAQKLCIPRQVWHIAHVQY